MFAPTAINWSTLYWGLQQTLLTNQAVINYAIDAVSAAPSVLDKDLLPLASAHNADPNLLQLLERMLPYDNSKPNYTNEARIWRYAELKQVQKKYRDIDPSQENQVEQCMSEIDVIYASYDFPSNMYIAHYMTPNEIWYRSEEFLHDVNKFMHEQLTEIKSSDQNH